jgi:hypothetical protein
MKDKSPHKIKVEKQIFRKQKDQPFKWKDIKNLELEDDDFLNFHWEEGYYSENNSCDGHFNGEIIRMVEETDEQFKRRMEIIERDSKWARERRYESYLKLKAEFETEVKE